MALPVNSAIEVFDTEVEVTDTSPGAVSSGGGFSSVSDTVEWTNAGNAPMAAFRLDCDMSTTLTSTARMINLYARLINISGAEDSPLPDANYKHIYIGSFHLKSLGASVPHTIAVVARLPNTKDQQLLQFFVENTTNANMNAGWQLFLTPKSILPKAT